MPRRRNFDPWSKKSKQGMRLLTNMTNFAIKAGTIAYNESKKQKKYSKMVTQYNNPEQTNITGGGCIVLIVGAILSIISVIVNESFLDGLVIGFVILCVSLFIAVIIGEYKKSSKEERANNVVKRNNEIALKNSELVEQTSSCILNHSKYDSLVTSYNTLPIEERQIVLMASFDNAVKSMQDSGNIPQDIQSSITDFVACFDLDIADFQSSESFKSLVKLLTINDLLNGIVPKRLNIPSSIPINLQKGEEVIWVCQGVTYYENCEVKTYVGASQGVSIRIAKGLYYRTGGFKGQPIISQQTRLKGVGDVYLTSKHFFFYSLDKAVRVPYAKIIAIKAFEDGIGIQKDGVNSKMMFFKDIDGWFVYNLIKNVQNMEIPKPSKRKPKAIDDVEIDDAGI